MEHPSNGMLFSNKKGINYWYMLQHEHKGLHIVLFHFYEMEIFSSRKVNAQTLFWEIGTGNV